MSVESNTDVERIEPAETPALELALHVSRYRFVSTLVAGRTVLDALEAEGRRLGVGRMVLETGTLQDRALALYRSCGFAVIPAFGEYIGAPATSICMGKEL